MLFRSPGSPGWVASLPGSSLGLSVSSSDSLEDTFLSSAALLIPCAAEEAFLESLGFLCIDVWPCCAAVGGPGGFWALLPSGCAFLGGPQIKFSVKLPWDFPGGPVVKNLPRGLRFDPWSRN